MKLNNNQLALLGVALLGVLGAAQEYFFSGIRGESFGIGRYLAVIRSEFGSLGVPAIFLAFSAICIFILIASINKDK